MPTRHSDSRRRSRSPSHEPRHTLRSRSPGRRHHHSRHHHGSGRRKHSPTPKPVALPFSARKLSKHDFATSKPMFALYLDIQKQLVLEDMDETEVKGRWKSFVGKWNRGELAEGWYDPATLDKAKSAAEEAHVRGRESPDYGAGGAEPSAQDPAPEEDGSEDDEFGPAALPGVSSRRSGPAIPRMEDLDLRREMADEDADERIAHLRYARRADRVMQKERLEELVPRADPGSRERQLEKKREKTATVNSFREAKSPGAEEVGEGDLMGEDGIDGYKAKKREDERRKNEREIRREEVLRARAAEREEKFAEHRAKEDKTMEMLKALAKQRYG